MSEPLVWSYGGGVQTAAIGVLIARGELPKPSLTVMADTGREASATWDYLNRSMRPLLSPLGVEVEIAPHSLATVDLRSRKGEELLPLFTAGGGKLPTYCSVEWKRRVVRRWLRERGIEACDLWLGISLDEVERAKMSDVKWITHRYPLLDLRLRRDECFQLVHAAGLPEPPRSSCWMCPHRRNSEWLFLTAEERERAALLEDEIRARDPGLFLHRSLRPLREVEWRPSSGQQLDLCDGGFCWT